MRCTCRSSSSSHWSGTQTLSDFTGIIMPFDDSVDRVLKDLMMRITDAELKKMVEALK